MAETIAERVELHLYDVSRGLAKRLAPVFLGNEVSERDASRQHVSLLSAF
jgi:hypothetical protein